MPKVIRGGKRLKGGDYHKHGKDLHYGDEFSTIAENKSLKVKVIINNIENSASAPQESKVPNRIYASPKGNNPNEDLKIYTFIDENGRKYKTIERGNHRIDGEITNPHTHKGFNHNEWGDAKPTQEELKMIASIDKWWYNYRHRK